MSLMRRNKKINKPMLIPALWISLGIHGVLVLILMYAAFTASSDTISEGNPAIRAIMIDPNVFAAPPVSMALQRADIVPDKMIQRHTPKQKTSVDQVVRAKAKSRANLREKLPHGRGYANRLRQDVIAPQRNKHAIGIAPSDHTQFARKPSPLHRKQPEYPMRAQAMRIEGKVVVQYDIDADGRVINIRIIEAKPNAIFNQSVRSAMRHWKYETRPTKNLTITIIFKQDKSVTLQNA